MKNLLSSILFFVLFSCGPNEAVIDPVAYAQEMADWQRSRYQTLKSPSGWLSLVGLEWIDEGSNSIGSGADTKLKIRSSNIPALLGHLQLDSNTFRFMAEPGLEVLVSSQPVSEYSWEFGVDENPVFEIESISFFVIKRHNRYALRVRDVNNPVLRAFQGTDFFDVNPEWRKLARFVPYMGGKDITIQNVSGMVDVQSSPGYLEFRHQGKNYRLDALVEDDQLFIIFNDETNGNETYGAGRYMYTSFPNEDGMVILDFNKCYCPPCAFTAFATCPLPPPQNRLPFAIYAGELNFDEGH